MHRRGAFLFGKPLLFLAFVALLSSASAYEPSARLVFLGDIMLGRGVAQARAGKGWDSVLGTLHPLTRSADLALANLESPIGCRPPGKADPWNLTAAPDAAAALASAGIDILNGVNNHARDSGEDGKSCARTALAAFSILLLEEENRPLEIEVNGLPIVFLAADFTNSDVESGLADLERSVRQASASRKLVVVSLHWGMEYQSGREPLQRRIALALSDAGADILWGHHPHTLQEWEWIGSAPVFYSLGNAVFDQHYPASVRRGGLAGVEIDRRGVRRVWLLPFAIDVRNGKTGPLDLPSLQVADSPLPATGSERPDPRPGAGRFPPGPLTSVFRSVE
ncbi:MAG: CapA family protein [Anaerolineales bacterium]|nr:CapA family protein [Anaerolineales bacterium]